MADDLYFIRSGDAVKIGRSGNVEFRLTRLRMVCPVPLELHAVLPGAGDTEAIWHLAFHDKRMHGEWFVWNRRLERAVKAALGGKDWVSLMRQSIQPALRRPGMTTQMVARLSRKAA